MPTYVAFLRAINLGAARKFPKDAVRACAEAAGFEQVETYLNTGNLRVSTRLRSRAKVEQSLERAFLADRGFEVPTMAFTSAGLVAVAEQAAQWAAGLPPVAMQYVSLLKEPAARSAMAQLEALDVAGEHVLVSDRAVHIALEHTDGYHAATITNALVEKRLGIATNRNLTVIRELASRWG
jgi:uncharacterized protein (DUF1697 family)